MTDTVEPQGGQESPAPPPEPAPAQGPVDTSFLDAAIMPPDVSDPGAPVYANDLRTPPPAPEPRHYPGYGYVQGGQYKAEYPYQPTSQTDDDLNDLVGNTRGYVSAIVNQILAERADPLLNRMAQASSTVDDFISNTAEAEAYNAKSNIDGLFQSVFRQDEDYMSNPDLRKAINTSIGDMLHTAVVDARSGKFGNIKKLSSWGPNQAMAALAASKQMFGTSANSAAPVGRGNYMATETPRASVPEYNVEITPEEEGVIAFRERLDPSFRERFIAAKQEAINRGDWEF